MSTLALNMYSCKGCAFLIPLPLHPPSARPLQLHLTASCCSPSSALHIPRVLPESRLEYDQHPIRGPTGGTVKAVNTSINPLSKRLAKSTLIRNCNLLLICASACNDNGRFHYFYFFQLFTSFSFIYENWAAAF